MKTEIIFRLKSSNFYGITGSSDFETFLRDIRTIRKTQADKVSGKLRNILEDAYEEDLCLNDVIKKLVSISEPLSKLEHKSSMHLYKQASKAMTEAKKKFQDFDKRFRGEIRDSVMTDISTFDKRVDPKKPDSFLGFLDTD